jgi:hypothetical protein
MHELCWLWGYLVLTTLLLYIVGSTLLLVCGVQLKGYLQLFTALLTSTVILTTTFAVYLSKGKTVYALLAGCIIGLVLQKLCNKQFWHNLKKSYSHIHINNVITTKDFKVTHQLQNGLILLVITLACYLPNALMLLKLGGQFPYYIPTQDLVGYSNFVKQLLLTQQENYNGLTANLIDSDFHGISPYHFYEFWLAAFIVKLTGCLPLFAYWLLVYPLFYLMTWAGILAVWEHLHTKITWKQQIVSFLLLFLGAIYFPFYDYLPYLDSTVYLHNNTLLTYGLLEPFLVAIYLLWQYQQKELAVVMLLIIPLLSITTLAGVTGAVLGIVWWAYRHQKRQLAYKSLGGLGCLLLGLGVLYSVWGTKNEAAFSWREFTPFVSTQLYDFPQNIVWVAKQMIVVFGLYLCKSLWVYAPYVFLLLIYYYPLNLKALKKIFSSIQYFCLMPLCGLAAMWLVMLHHDASQTFRNFCFPVLNLLLVLWFVHYFSQLPLLQHRQKHTITFFILLVGYQMAYSAYYKYRQVAERQEYSEAYLLHLQKIITKLPENSLGAFIYPPSFYADDLFSKVIRHQLPAGYLALFPNVAGIVNLGVFEIPYSQQAIYKLQEGRLRKNSEFYQFVQKRQKTNNVRSIVDLQNEFIYQYPIQFILIGKNISLDSLRCNTCIKASEDVLYGEKLLLK